MFEPAARPKDRTANAWPLTEMMAQRHMRENLLKVEVNPTVDKRLDAFLNSGPEYTWA